MRYVIGVDGGPTSTTAVLVDSTGNLLGAGHGGTALIEHGEFGAQRVRRSVADAILGAISKADLENARISAACVSIPGDFDEIECIVAPVIPADHLSIGAPPHIALNTVALGSPGVVVIADNGAEAFGINYERQSASAGGWGQTQGDEGSAYWIGLKALNACCRDRDTIGPSTLILPLLLQHLEAGSLQHIHHRIKSGLMSRSEVAGLTEIVSVAASQGDAVAKRLLREAGKELGLMACALLPKLDMVEQPVTVGTVGGVFRAGRLVLRTFRELVQAAAPNCRIMGPQVPAAVGAALVAMADIGIVPDAAAAANIVATLPRLGCLRAA